MEEIIEFEDAILLVDPGEISVYDSEDFLAVIPYGKKAWRNELTAVVDYLKDVIEEGQRTC